MRAVKNLPSVSLYVRITEKKGRRRYERIRRRNPQMCGPSDVYCIHSYQNGKRKWLSAGTDLTAANRARGEKEQELAAPRDSLTRRQADYLQILQGRVLPEGMGSDGRMHDGSGFCTGEGAELHQNSVRCVLLVRSYRASA